MNFIERDKIDKFFIELKNEFRNNKYKNFFNYFSRTWLGKRYPSKIWNYNDIVKNDNELNHFHFTNNITENIQRFLNSQINRNKCSNIYFRETILKIISQFDNKGENIELLKKNLI